MRHKSPGANKCPSPGPAGERVFRSCGLMMNILKPESAAVLLDMNARV